MVAFALVMSVLVAQLPHVRSLEEGRVLRTWGWRFGSTKERTYHGSGPILYAIDASPDALLHRLVPVGRVPGLRDMRVTELKSYPKGVVPGPSGTLVLLYPSRVEMVSPQGLALWRLTFKQATVHSGWSSEGRLYLNLDQDGAYSLAVYTHDGSLVATYDVEEPVRGACHGGLCLVVDKGTPLWLEAGRLERLEGLVGCTTPVFVDRRFMLSCSGTLYGVEHGSAPTQLARGVEAWLAYPELVVVSRGSFLALQEGKWVPIGKVKGSVLSWASPGEHLAWVLVRSGTGLVLVRLQRHAVAMRMALPGSGSHGRATISLAYERRGVVMVVLSMEGGSQYVVSNVSLPRGGGG